MRVLIDINHPGQVHLFRPLAETLMREGGEVLCTARDKDVTRELLERGNIPYVICSIRRPGMLNLVRELFCKTRAIATIGKDFRPDAIVSLGSPPAAWAALRLRVPHIALEDTEHSTEQALLYLPFTQYVLTSTAFCRELGKKQVRYRGYHELAYLHPEKFTPDASLVRSLGLPTDSPYSVARFVSWQASHDIGQHGIRLKDKSALLETLLSFGPVVLTSETELPGELAGRCLVVPPETIHHVLAFARLYVGEGATMASEAAMLGIPAIYTNTLSAGTLEDQERYGLLYRETAFEKVLDLARSILSNPAGNIEFQVRRQRMLSDMEDVTEVILQTLRTAIRERSPEASR